MAKYYTVDPNTCSKEDLEQAIIECGKKEDFYNNAQLSTKIAINSIYGVFGSAFYSLRSTDIAESITLQGQDLIKYSVRVIDDYFKNKWPSDIDAHNRVADYMLQRFPDFDKEKFLSLSCQNIEFGETSEIYGDSVSGDSLISVSSGKRTISELFDNGILAKTVNDKEYRKSGELAYTYSNGQLLLKNIKYVIRHKTSKDKWRITDTDGNVITVTSDHSVMVIPDFDTIMLLNGNEPIELSPKYIDSSYTLVTIDESGNVKYNKVAICEKIGTFDDEYVYDIEIDTDDENRHNFFANNVLVHNTDSVHKTTLIRTEKHPDGIEIEKWYEENIDNSGPSTKAGHESVFTSDKALNCVFDYDLKKVVPRFCNVKRIIRHNVDKPKWTVAAQSGKCVSCTGDHSIIVFDQITNKRFIATPDMTQATDLVITYNQEDGKEPYLQMEHFKAMKREEPFTSEEYVYDIEMDDDTHTFIANDILVHNSAYITVQPFVEAYGIPLEQQITFVLAINNCILTSYLDKAFDEYAKSFNCPENKEKFELEKVARSVIMLAKKKYIMDIGWAEPDVFHAPLHKLTIKGIEAIQGSVPEFCRNQMKDFIKFMLNEIDNGTVPTYDAVIHKLKEIKNKFALQSPNEISKSFKMSDYEKYIINDKGLSVQYAQVQKQNKQGESVVTDITVPMHVKAAAAYNNMLYNKAKRFKSKYNTIKKGDKIKFYYTADGSTFAFLPDSYPVEFAPKMDVDQQFEKMLLDPLNRIISAVGYSAVPSTLTYSASLW